MLCYFYRQRLRLLLPGKLSSWMEDPARFKRRGLNKGIHEDGSPGSGRGGSRSAVPVDPRGSRGSLLGGDEMDDVCWMSGAALARAVKRKELSPVEVVRAFLDRVDRINGTVNAVVALAADTAAAEARSAEQA